MSKPPLKSSSTSKRATLNSSGIRLGRTQSLSQPLTTSSRHSKHSADDSSTPAVVDHQYLQTLSNLCSSPIYTPPIVPTSVVKMAVSVQDFQDLQQRLVSLEMKNQPGAIAPVGHGAQGARIPRLNPPSYTGIGSAKLWCQQFKDIMQANAWNDAIAMTMLPTCMAPNSLAYTWYSSVDKTTVDTPEKFFKALQTYFKPDTMTTLHSLYSRHQYADEDVKDYYKAITDIIAMMDAAPDVETQALVFIKGLRDDIRPFVASQKHANINAAFQHAVSMQASLPPVRLTNVYAHQVHAIGTAAMTTPSMIPSTLAVTVPPVSTSSSTTTTTNTTASDKETVLANTIKQMNTTLHFMKKEMQRMNNSHRNNFTGNRSRDDNSSGQRPAGRYNSSRGGNEERKMCSYCEKGYHAVQNCWTLQADVKENRVRAGYESYANQSKNSQ